MIARSQDQCRRTPTERGRRIIQRYLDGEPIASIAAAEGIHSKTVRNVARRANLPHRRPPRSERNARIISRYAGGEPVVEIANGESVRSSYVSSLARKAGLPRRTGWQRRYRIDEAAFDQPDSVGWWLIGLLAADGCVHEPEHRVSLTQRAEDIDVLHVFLKYVGSEGRPLTELSWPNGRPEWCRRDARYLEARVHSRRICLALARHGVVPRKTQGFSFSAMASRQPAVWLGLLDGDGWASARLPCGRSARICFYGPRSVLEQCSAFWASKLAVRSAGGPSVAPHGKHLHVMRLYGPNASRAAGMMLDASPVSLTRKRRVLEEIAGHPDQPFTEEQTRVVFHQETEEKWLLQT
jgi:hypothetical protein